MHYLRLQARLLRLSGSVEVLAFLAVIMPRGLRQKLEVSTRSNNE